jgi:hypothetical protein
MPPIDARVVRLFWIAVALTAAWAPAARAQDDQPAAAKPDQNGRPPARAVDDHESEEIAEPAVLAPARAAELHARHQAGLEEQFAQQRAMLKVSLDRALWSRLADIGRRCQLTPAQAKKLTLAGRVTIKEFMDRWDSVARRLLSSQRELEDPRRVRLEWGNLQLEIANGVLGEDSVFSKTLTRTLEPEQARRLKSPAVERRPNYENVVARAVDSLRRNLALSAQQAEDLRRLIMRETRPPRQFGRATDVALVVFQLSRLPEQTVKTLLDEAQWRQLSHRMEAYKKGSAAADTLKQKGFIFDDTPVTRPVAPPI